MEAIKNLSSVGWTLIESYNLAFLTGGGANTGLFVGFLESSPTISYFTLTDNYVGITDLTTTAAAVPEPSGLLLMVGVALAVGGLVRRKLPNC